MVWNTRLFEFRNSRQAGQVFGERREGNHKSQNAKRQKNPNKSEISKACRGLETWVLEFLWRLKIGVWDFCGLRLRLAGRMHFNPHLLQAPSHWAWSWQSDRARDRAWPDP